MRKWLSAVEKLFEGEDEALSEGRARRVVAATGAPFTIWENPTAEQLRSVFASATDYLRGLLSRDGRRLLVWDGFHAQHTDGWSAWHGDESGKLAASDPDYRAQIPIYLSPDEVITDPDKIDAVEGAPALVRVCGPDFPVRAD